MALCLLGDDVLGLILEGLRNPLDPRAAVSLGSVSRRLRALTQELRRQLRADHRAAAAMCLMGRIGAWLAGLCDKPPTADAKKATCDIDFFPLGTPEEALQSVRRALIALEGLYFYEFH